jgi:hypothetical protein
LRYVFQSFFNAFGGQLRICFEYFLFRRAAGEEFKDKLDAQACADDVRFAAKECELNK